MVQFTADYGTTGEQVINYLVTNWRDPIVVSYTPSGTGKVSPRIPFTVTWNQPMPANTTFSVQLSTGQPVSGRFTYDPDTFMVTFVPDQPITGGLTYKVVVSGQKDTTGEVQLVPVTWTVTTTPYDIWIPLLMKP